MGFLRTITLYNDCWHQNAIRANPERFVKELCEAMDRADETHARYGIHNGISVYPSRHADDHTVFVHYGNSVVDITGRDFQDRVMKEMPDVAKRFLKIAQDIVTYTKGRLSKRVKKP